MSVTRLHLQLVTLHAQVTVTGDRDSACSVAPVAGRYAQQLRMTVRLATNSYRQLSYHIDRIFSLARAERVRPEGCVSGMLRPPFAFTVRARVGVGNDSQTAFTGIDDQSRGCADRTQRSRRLRTVITIRVPAWYGVNKRHGGQSESDRHHLKRQSLMGCPMGERSTHPSVVSPGLQRAARARLM